MSDPLEPTKIEHVVETDLNVETGACSYHYNFLIYTFQISSGVLKARSYLDDIAEVSLLHYPGAADVETELAGVLAYLRWR